MGTVRHENHTSVTRIFKGRRECTGHRGKRGALRIAWSLSPGEPIPGSALLDKKRQLFPGLPPASPGSFASPPSAPEGTVSPWPGTGILTRFPFGLRSAQSYEMPPLRNGVSLSLRTDSPMFNCCSHGTLLHFGLQSSRLNICYYHQDLRPRRLHPDSRPRLPRSPRRPSYSSRPGSLTCCRDGTVWVQRSSAIHFQG